MLQKEEIDLAVTLIEKQSAPGIRSLALLELPLVLLAETGSSVTSAEQLWKRDKIDERLICLPPGAPLCKNFQQKLAELGVDWFPSIEASSVDLIETYVANGLGIGVSVAIPKKTLPPNVRALPLRGFPPVVVGAMWRGRMTSLMQAFLEEMKLSAQRLT